MRPFRTTVKMLTTCAPAVAGFAQGSSYLTAHDAAWWRRARPNQKAGFLVGCLDCNPHKPTSNLVEHRLAGRSSYPLRSVQAQTQ